MRGKKFLGKICGSEKESLLCGGRQHQPNCRALVSVLPAQRRSLLRNRDEESLAQGIRTESPKGSRYLERMTSLGLATLVLSFAFVTAAEAFTIISTAGKPARWKDGKVSYQLHNVPPEFHSAIDSSFGVWSAIHGVDLSIQNLGETAQAPSSKDGQNTISWVTSNWRNLSFRPPANALAVTLSSFSGSTGLILDADIYFNAQFFDWKNVDPGNPADKSFVDVHNIGTHEVGHLLGLDHSSEDFFELNDDLYEATMFYASSTGETFRRIPKEDDELGIRSLYPSTALPRPEISSIELIEQTGPYVVYRIRGENFGPQTSFIISSGDLSEWDRVSRYRQIKSSTEADVEFHLGGFGKSEAILVAMNDSTGLSTVNISLFAHGQNVASSSSGLSSSSSGGGSGCQIQAFHSSSSLLLALLALALLACLRGRRGSLLGRD